MSQTLKNGMITIWATYPQRGDAGEGKVLGWRVDGPVSAAGAREDRHDFGWVAVTSTLVYN